MRFGTFRDLTLCGTGDPADGGPAQGIGSTTFNDGNCPGGGGTDPGEVS
jgi:hypothetical protein